MKIRFVKSEPDRYAQFNRVVNELSKVCNLRTDVVKYYMEYAFVDYGEWSLNNHFIVKSTEKQDEMEKISMNLKKNFHPLIQDSKLLETAIQVAQPAIDMMFDVE